MRSDVQRRVRDAVAFVVSARPARLRTLLVAGAVGSGKTATAWAVADAVPDDHLLLVATGSMRERSVDRGLLDQIFTYPGLSDGVGEAIDELSALFACPPGRDRDLRRGRVIRLLARALVSMTMRQPMVIVIDDVHLADDVSLDDLGFLWRRLAGADLAVILTHPYPIPGPLHPWLVEVATHPRTHRLRLEPMRVSEVTDALALRLGGAGARALAPDAHGITGGSPKLVAALVADQPPRSPDDRGGLLLVRGEEFCAGVVACLGRLPPDVQTTGHALAVLRCVELGYGIEEYAPMLARILGYNVVDIHQKIAVLHHAGLVSGARFRCETAAAAVVASMPSDERIVLQTVLGERLYADGISSVLVARVLGCVTEVPADWGVEVLHEAALDDLRHDRVPTAMTRLETAARSTDNPARAASVNFLRLRTAWRLRPGSCGRLIDLAVTAVTDGHFDDAEIEQLSWYLSWYGLSDRLVDTDVPVARENDLFVSALCDVGGVDDADSVPDTVTVAHVWNPEGRSADPRPTLPTNVGAEEVAPIGPPRRSSAVLDEKFESYMAALSAIPHAGGHRDAIAQCDAFLESVRCRNAPTWEAIAVATRAVVCLRTGALEKAYHAAVQSMSMLSAADWGVALGGPLAVAVIAAASRGRHGDVATLLRIPLPSGVLDTRFGIVVERARGVAMLALGHAAEAGRCFLRCRAMIVERGDPSSFIPWRADLAQAYLALGKRDAAQRLAQTHLELAVGAGSRTRGLALHMYASTLDEGERIPCLTEAAEALGRVGDRYNEARALIDLAHDLDIVGDADTAQIVARRATTLARWCGADSLLLDPVLASQVGIEGLTAAEHRVACLASEGRSNKAISEELFVTVSTIEQHLTRVYRKLGIDRRSDIRDHLAEPPTAWQPRCDMSS